MKRLTEEQQLELAACYAEFCGIDPTMRDDWRKEMVGAKKFVRELMAVWRRREKDKPVEGNSTGLNEQ